MQRVKKTAAVALFVFLVSSAPSFAFSRDDVPSHNDPIDRVVRVIKKIVRPIARILDDIRIPQT